MTKTLRIALADDHELVRSGLTALLQKDPRLKVVQESSNGRELLDGLVESKPDVVVLDLEMPVLSGQDALIELRYKFPDIKVLILTMFDGPAQIRQLMETGAHGYLVKDGAARDVVQAIYKVVQSGYYFSDRVSLALLSQSPEKHEQESLQEPLTEREADVLRLICREYTTAEIAETLFLSAKTIEGYRKVLLDKTESRNMAGLVLYAVRNGYYQV